MKILFASFCLLLCLSPILAQTFVPANQDTFVIGGEYRVDQGEILKGNLYLLFAQVTIDQGGRVNGGILSLSSAVEVFGDVDGPVESVESDIDIKETAQVSEIHNRIGTFPYVILLPQMARVGNASAE